MHAANVIDGYLEFLDAQRQQAFAALAGLSEAMIWRRPAPKSWSVGEIVNHNYRDPFFGWLNLILTLRLGIYHDQLHYDDVTRQARAVSA